MPALDSFRLLPGRYIHRVPIYKQYVYQSAVPAVVGQVTTRTLEYRPLASADLGKQNGDDNPRPRLPTSWALLPIPWRSGARTTRGVATCRRATWMNPARSEHRKILYNSNFVHFTLLGSVGQHFHRAGGRRAGARTRRPAVLGSRRFHGITSRPSSWHAQARRRGGGPIHHCAVTGYADGPREQKSTPTLYRVAM